MRIINLIENTSADNGCMCEHGLSFYIETAKHKLLVDTGATGAFLENAQKLSVDLSQVDTVILSHGHYDHGGGLLAFAALNPNAKIYVRENAFGGFYHVRAQKQMPEDKEVSAVSGSTPETVVAVKKRYIGLAPEIAELPQIVRVRGNLMIDEELFLFTNVSGNRAKPAGNDELMEECDGALFQDDFSHEQYLVITDTASRENAGQATAADGVHGGRKVLVSGCAHNGILNILDEYRRVVGGEPDMVISGFHMKKKQGYEAADVEVMEETARELAAMRTRFYTGHCTGEEPFSVMEKIMGGKLTYVRSGEEIRIF